MSISWKDAVATLLTSGIVVIAYAKLKGFSWPLLGSYRVASLILLVLGIGGCIAVSSSGSPFKDAWTTTASILGMAAFGIGLLNLVMNNRLLFIVLAADMVALWVVTTLHHFLTKAV